MIDTPRYKLAEKRVRYGLYVYAIAAMFLTFRVFLKFVNPEKYPFDAIMAFLPLCLVIVGWAMRLSGRHEMRAEEGTAS